MLGIVSTLVAQYILILNHLHKRYDQVNIQTFVTEIDKVINPIKRKKEHYINSYTLELQLPNDEKAEEIQMNQTLVKLKRKKFIKKVEQHLAFLQALRDADQLHGKNLEDYDQKNKLTFELDQQIHHRITDQDNEIVIKISGWEFQEGHQIQLPTWNDFKRIFKKIGSLHLEQSNLIQSSFNEINIKKDYVKEIEEFRKQRKKLKQINSDAFTHQFKVSQEASQVDKDAQTQKQIYLEMTKRREDPALIIKQEMKAKLALQAQDTLRPKIQDANERLREAQIQVAALNKKMQEFNNKWEEQRLISLKKSLQAILQGYEDLSSSLIKDITQLIFIVDKDLNQLFPIKQNKQSCSPKSFTHMIQSGEIEELVIVDQFRVCQKQTQYLLQQFQMIQKYDEEIEMFLKELSYICVSHSNQLEDHSVLQKQLQTDDVNQQEPLRIVLKGIIHGINGIKEIYKILSESLEKKRQEIGKQRLDYGKGKELETCAIRDIKRLQQLNQDEKALEKYQEEPNNTGKIMAQQFFQEVKTNLKDITSLGKFVSTVGSTAKKIKTMSNTNNDEFTIKQQKLADEQKQLLSLQGFTLKNLEDFLEKHHRAIAKIKKQVIDELGRFSIKIGMNLRQVVDEMAYSMSHYNQMPQVKQIQEEPEKQPDQIKEEQSIIQDEDVDLNPIKMVSKLFQVLYNEWKNSEYFNKKMRKLLHKTFNKKRNNILSEIEVVELVVIGDPPQITNMIPQRQDKNEFLCDFDISYRGRIQLLLQTNIIINWPKENYAQVPVSIKVLISTFTGRLRICYVPQYMGKSWLSMIGQPVLNLDIEPTISQKFNIANIPSVGDLMREFLINKIKLMTYPNKLTIPLPISRK
ncbi:hypothetical protein pb186bvf_001176 [Paramecium bursaria]